MNLNKIINVSLKSILEEDDGMNKETSIERGKGTLLRRVVNVLRPEAKMGTDKDTGFKSMAQEREEDIDRLKKAAATAGIGAGGEDTAEDASPTSQIDNANIAPSEADEAVPSEAADTATQRTYFTGRAMNLVNNAKGRAMNLVNAAKDYASEHPEKVAAATAAAIAAGLGAKALINKLRKNKR